MNFDFTEDQQAIKDQVRRVTEHLVTNASRRRVFEGEASYDDALWREFATLGFTAATLPAEYGGLDLGDVVLCGIAEEAGRSLASMPLNSSIYLAAHAILLGGDDDLKAKWLSDLAQGKRIGTFALGSSTITASHEGLLTGVASMAPDGGVADIAVVPAAVDGGTTRLHLVDLRGAGVGRKMLAGIDPSRPVAQLRFAKTVSAPLAERTAGRNVAEVVIDRAAVLVAFEQLGGAEAALNLARDYALERHAFGRPIGAFQAIKHKLAEIYVAIELARSQCFYAAWALDADDPGIGVAAASARLSATAAFELAARELIQIHGGIGMTWEHDAHLYYRRSRYLALLLGSSQRWSDLLICRLAAERG